MKTSRIVALFLSIVLAGLLVQLSPLATFEEKTKETAIVFNSTSDQHTLLGHPENALRLEAILNQLKVEKLWDQVSRLEAREATFLELSLFHTEAYLRRIERSSADPKIPYLENEKWAPYNSRQAAASAKTAVGSLIDLTRLVARGVHRNGFAIIRPPGHHAKVDKGMGFCIFNSIAIATKNLLQDKLVNRVLIFDMDAHHGNGIAEAFQDSQDVAYVSFYQSGIFPYSDNRSFNRILNVPLAFQEREENYFRKFEERVPALFKEFRPEFVIVSAGYDAHWRDSMSNLGLSLQGYAQLSKRLVELAEEYSGGRIVFSLEGGYDLEVLSIGAANTLKALLKRDDFRDPVGPFPGK